MMPPGSTYPMANVAASASLMSAEASWVSRSAETCENAVKATTAIGKRKVISQYERLLSVVTISCFRTSHVWVITRLPRRPGQGLADRP